MGIAQKKVLRGGSWNNEARNLRGANRNNEAPADRNNKIGVRCRLWPGLSFNREVHGIYGCRVSIEGTNQSYSRLGC